MINDSSLSIDIAASICNFQWAYIFIRLETLVRELCIYDDAIEVDSLAGSAVS
jgi:hypothetical protein